MGDCHSEQVRSARQGIVDELARFWADSSETRLATLKAAIENWHDAVGAWSKIDRIEPPKQDLS